MTKIKKTKTVKSKPTKIYNVLVGNFKMVFKIDPNSISEDDINIMMDFHSTEVKSDDIYEDFVSLYGFFCVNTMGFGKYSKDDVIREMAHNTEFLKLDNSIGVELIEYVGVSVDELEIEMV